MMENDSCLTVGQFCALLEKILCDVQKDRYRVDVDILQQPEEHIKRRTAAGIIHHMLLRTGEADEEHTEAALRLKDLYTCRTCVNHIAQVYAKGIMDEWDDGAFGLDGQITYREAEEMLQRAADRRLRRKPEPPVRAGWTEITWQEAERMLREDRKILLVDVRSEAEYSQGHRKGSINVPLQALFLNPYGVCADRAAVLFLYCRTGAKGRIAAGLLADAGYRNVYVVVLLRKESEDVY